MLSVNESVGMGFLSAPRSSGARPAPQKPALVVYPAVFMRSNQMLPASVVNRWVIGEPLACLEQ
jgi:hypothetical protein